MLPGVASIIAGLGSSGIVFVGGAVASKNGAVSGNSTIALNSGLSGGVASSAASGDFVIAAFATGAASDVTLAITDGSSDYTLIGSELYANDTEDVNLRVAYKFITSDTEVTFGPTHSTSDGGSMAVYVFRNVNISSPLDVAAATATGLNTFLCNPPAITPSTAGAFIVSVGAATVGSYADGSPTPPEFASSDLTAFLTTPGPAEEANIAALGIGHKNNWTSGEFDPAAFTVPNDTDSSTYSWAAVTFALRSA
jgi:hypothetical protein